jgi:translation initiation factor 3 subunit A
LQLFLETRFEQLKIATELELWQEAFCSIEDIHGLMSMVKKTPKPQMMAIYYAKFMKIFWVSDSHLYHAYAWYKLYNSQKSYNKNLLAKDLQLMASSVLLATLAVTPYDRKYGALNWKWRKIGIYKWPIFWVSLLSPRRILTPSVVKGCTTLRACK